MFFKFHNLSSISSFDFKDYEKYYYDHWLIISLYTAIIIENSKWFSIYYYFQIIALIDL